MKNLGLDIATGLNGETLGDRYPSESVALNNSQRVDKVVNYMIRNLHKPLQASELAASANLSISHFFVLFKQRTSYTPLYYFTRLRILRACQLLESTELRVKEVAAALGYEDPFYFSRVFKSFSTVAPNQYRCLDNASRLEIKRLLDAKQMLSANRRILGCQSHGGQMRRRF